MVEKKHIYLGIGIFVILNFIGSLIILFFFGWMALWKIVRVVGIIIIVLLFIGALVYLFYFLFIKKQKFDVTAVNRKKLVLAGKIQCPSSIYDRRLRLSGDKGHSWVSFGKIKGYLRIQILTRDSVYDEKGEVVYDIDEYQRKIPKYKLSTVEQDVFIVQRGVFPMTLVVDEDVVRVDPTAHDELIGDVTIFGLNLVPLSEYWYLASDYLHVRNIDRAILLEAERGVLFEMLKDTKTIVDQAINLDQAHRKIIEEKSLMEIPQLQQIMGNK